MNRWLNRKKDGAADDAAAAKKSKKSKKGQEEPKPEFDLNAVLPKADDFRTSLIMPGLSTRFSMLREQDDPSSVIGKASDDSVLQPKRQSRLHEFGFVPGGLSDIAEVSSLNGSIRRPFANERTNSFDSSQTDDGAGSVMTRARPGEGNILFGGRQKIYMISNTNSKGTGRTLYDDDVNMSAYQRLRQEEKERLRQQAEDDEERRSEPSSPTELSRKRETSSSTNSGTVDARTSTTATSIASQGANSVSVTSPTFSPTMSSPDLSRNTTKRRLYDNGLDQQIQDQQSSAMSRLNSIQRARAPTGRSTPPIGQARSATNLNDRFARGPGFRSDSPNALGYPGISRNNSVESSPVLNRAQSPALTSPVISESDEAYTLNAALQPNDRGKATAMGAFNKPKEAFSEEQYAERLRHLQQDREVRETPTTQLQKSPSQKPSLRERAEQQRRKRAESDAKSRERSESPAGHQPASSAFSRFQTAASQMRTTGPGTPTSPPTPPPTQKLPAVPSHGRQSPDDDSKSTFLASPDDSDDEEERVRPPIPTRRYENLPVATGPAPSMFEHPAFRSRTTSDEEVHRSDPAVYSPLSPQDSAHANDSRKPSGMDVDSPTLGPDTGGLSGMIRQHLRNVSNVSSNYGEPGPPVMSPPVTGPPMGLAIQTQNYGLQRRQPGSDSATPAPSTHSHSNPWDLDDIDNPYRDEHGSMTSTSPSDGPRSNPLIMSATEPKSNDSWDLTPRRNHERIASNETEAEHEAFQRDLAQRQRLIQENLRAKAEGRSLSPAPGPSGGLKNALNMLRAKSSRESFATVDVSSKSVRKLALGGASGNVSSISLAGQNGGDVAGLRSKPSRLLQQSEQDAQREHEYRQRSGTDSNRTGRPTGRSGPMSTRSSTRERSSSGTSSGRSRSRTDQYRDDLDQAMTEGSRGAYPANTLPSVSGYSAHSTPPLPTERPSLDSQGRMRSRSNSKTTAANYFESKHLQPIQTNGGAGQNSRSPLQGKFSPGLPVSPRPSPGGFNMSGNGQPQSTSPMPPFSANDTPPVSTPTTPSSTAFNPKTVQPFNKQGPLRKKSVVKSEIGEPVFISTTSVIDTINLPPGASLKNGAEVNAPPVPPINPMRRRFGFGRGEAQSPSSPSPYDPAVQHGMEGLRAPYSEAFRSESSDAVHQAAPKSRLRKTSSEGKSLRGDGPSQSGPSPAMPQNGFTERNNSPPRAINGQPLVQQPMEGGMF
ncbi:hypothetical protein PtrSN002B_011080 [Pyrenophora tritici-repentis]|nr:hypothetical protein PtrV1_11186 [Pyrenophora tritici-repentis]KAF7443619.1 hypothetical protein A1F99_116930 [Pyrenophora tritici-repentis]KAF7566662.1 DUF4045 multi-domain protein [Pyrenophora tritici-repentis]KAG9379357.1 hypothetical protein A1F94_009713 [Pyrenophora tritici-repentis]KAI0570264.1 hypothetical protein Alg215_11161 [Pyrenophora tritici-repentis]